MTKTYADRNTTEMATQRIIMNNLTHTVLKENGFSDLGNIMRSLDYEKSASGYVKGFWYDIEHKLLDWEILLFVIINYDETYVRIFKCDENHQYLEDFIFDDNCMSFELFNQHYDHILKTTELEQILKLFHIKDAHIKPYDKECVIVKWNDFD